MTRHLLTTLAAAAVALAFVQTADAADKARAETRAGDAVTVDAPDLFRVNASEVEPRFTTLLGVSVYSNRGKRIGEIEDFVLGKDGQAYAIVDTADGPIEEIAQLGDHEVVVVPLRELRNRAWQD